MPPPPQAFLVVQGEVTLLLAFSVFSLCLLFAPSVQFSICSFFYFLDLSQEGQFQHNSWRTGEHDAKIGGIQR